MFHLAMTINLDFSSSSSTKCIDLTGVLGVTLLQLQHLARFGSEVACEYICQFVIQ
jgi:hypothetical protein